MIVAVRHPRPDISPGICYGRLDLALAEAAAPTAATVLRQIAPSGIDVIVSSPLQRAMALADELAGQSGLEVRIEPELQEMSFGSWEGVAWSDIPRAQIDAWSADVLGYRPPGGETVSELYGRVSSLYRRAVRDGSRQLWVTHAGPMRCLSALAERRPLLECLARTFDYGAVLTVAEPG